MARSSWLQRLYWRYFAKPATCRDLFLYVSENPIVSILEIGMGDGSRIQSLVPLCKRAEDTECLRYAALDPFESGEGRRLSLKGAHRLLQELGLKTHLIPGDPASGILRLAHTVLPSDLVIVDGFWGDGSERARILEQWLPRLCHRDSGVFVSNTEGGKLQRLETPATASGVRNRAKAA